VSVPVAAPDALGAAEVDDPAFGTRTRGSTSAGWHLAALAGILIVAALLRFPLLDRVPNGLFLDEASRGYDAYSLVKTGADQYGVRWPLFAEGLDDYTPALYTYLVVPVVAVLGPTVTAVRLPAALIGTTTVGLTYGLTAAWFGRGVGLTAAALLAIAPWHVLPSRTGTEWVLLPAVTTLGVWLLHAGLKRPTLLVVAGGVLGIGLYSYAFARLLIPMLVLGFAVLWGRELRAKLAWALGALGLFCLLAAPLAQFATTEAGRARLAAVVPLNKLSPAELIPYAIGNYLSYFSPSFLIWGSERTHHHRLEGFGPVLPFMAPLVVLGLLEVARRRYRGRLFWAWWLLAAPAASALHRESPTSALLVGAVPSWHVVSALGGAWLVRWAGSFGSAAGRLALAGMLGAAAITTGLAARALYVDYPSYAARDWQFGADEIVHFLEARRFAYDAVLVSDRLDTPHVLVLYLVPVDPVTYHLSPIHVNQPNLRSRGQAAPYRFGRIGELLEQPGRHLVWVGADEEVPALVGLTPIFTVAYPSGRPAHLVYDVERP
jgi:4-amino-4-deoxy-L-arabinose transferase-like glycosyltransferase